MNKVLVIGAHEDDESFGALGTLLKRKAQGARFHFLWFCDGRQSSGEYPVVDFFEASYSHAHYADQMLDTSAIKELILRVEEAVALFNPTTVYMPFIGDLNCDHRLVAEAAMVACRPYKEGAPKEVWMYAIDGTTELGPREFKVDREEKIDAVKKEELIRKWYPHELTSGRNSIKNTEVFERWPRQLERSSKQ